ncbi:MAG TPA: histidinol-phosphate transaminase [Candidatus Mcinerneyibacteriales bacterium]|nr:histidinol-phosphate transaminase [Candidatus Mcinerneyibacteriales bacterium]
MIRMHMNESPYDFPFRAKLKVTLKALFTSWNRYPEELNHEALNELSLYTGKNAENLWLGNGSNELIRLAFLAWGDKGKRVLMISPGFITYEKEAARSGCEAIRVPLKNDLSFDRTVFLDEVKRADLVILISPGNPSGESLPVNFIEKVARKCPGRVLIDEAYGEFAGESCIPLIERHENVVILRTLSKAFGLAGARIGYAIGAKRTIEELRKVSLPYNPGFFSLLLLKEAVGRKRVMEKRVAKLRSERARLIVRLKKSPFFTVVPGEANFILVREKTPESRQALLDSLDHERIVPRVYENGPLATWLRFTVGRPRENNRLLKAVDSVQRRLS